uniref:Uncharacterized protein n=1 Tax=Meloidogyne enterolobii TaxID=390850 RepID=A0A6V7UDC7_MELEN|nr:unnamed protein product [Meloidogyne enterolobii]
MILVTLYHSILHLYNYTVDFSVIMQLSSLAELKLNPAGSWLGFCRGLIKSVLKSSTKTTIILECDSGELFVVTAFHTTKNSASILESCVCGNIVKFENLKVQKFNSERFDGQKYYNTPLGFEFVVQSATVVEITEGAITKVSSIADITKSGVFALTCILSGSFVDINGLLCVVVGDTNNNRADLHINATKKSKDFKDLDKGNVLEIKKCFAAIEDQCIVLKTSEDDVTISKKKMVIGKMLSTPIKAKDGEKK